MWDAIGFVISSKYRLAVIMGLRSGFKTPSEISEETGLGLSQISRAISELSDFELVECLTPKLLKGRLFKLTEKGESILGELIKRGEK